MDTSLLEWILTRYMLHIFLIIVCLIWALYDPSHQIYEPPKVSIHILDESRWKFSSPDYAPASIGQSIWHLGINRNIDQLDAMRRPIKNPLWDDLDSLLDEWELKLNDSN